MKISFVADQMRSGGAERVIANLSSEFVSLGHIVSIIMVNELEGHSLYALDDKIVLIPVKKEDRKYSAAGKISLLRKIIKETNPDILISFQNHIHVFTHFAALGLNAMHIVSERSDPKQYPKSRVTRLLRSLTFKRASGCVFQTKTAKAFFPERVQRKSVVIPNPVVLLCEPSKPPVREKRVVAVGRLVVSKNYDMLIRAFALFSIEIPGYELVICGEGEMRKHIESIADELELADKVKLIGHVENPHEIVCGSSAFVLSSDFEGMPNALLEAMALCVPVISTDCLCGGGTAEIITDGENGLLVPVGDEKAMAKAIAAVIENPEFSSKLSENASVIRREFSKENIAEKGISYFESYS